jgi:hypothetical protein
MEFAASVPMAGGASPIEFPVATLWRNRVVSLQNRNERMSRNALKVAPAPPLEPYQL